MGFSKSVYNIHHASDRTRTAGHECVKSQNWINRFLGNISYIVLVIKCLQKFFLDLDWRRKHQDGHNCPILASLARWLLDVDPPVWRTPSIHCKPFRRRTDIWETSPAAWRQMPNERTALLALTTSGCVIMLMSQYEKEKGCFIG